MCLQCGEEDILFLVAYSLSCVRGVASNDLLEASSSFVGAGRKPYGLEPVYFYDAEGGDTLCLELGRFAFGSGSPEIFLLLGEDNLLMVDSLSNTEGECVGALLTLPWQ